MINEDAEKDHFFIPLFDQNTTDQTMHNTYNGLITPISLNASKSNIIIGDGKEEPHTRKYGEDHCLRSRLVASERS